MTMYSAGATATLATVANPASAGDVRRFSLTAHVSSNCVGTFKQWDFYARFGSAGTTSGQIELGGYAATTDSTGGAESAAVGGVRGTVPVTGGTVYFVAVPRFATCAWYSDGGSSATIDTGAGPGPGYHPEGGGVTDPNGFFYYYRTGGTGFAFPGYMTADAGAIGGRYDQSFGGNVGNLVHFGPVSGPATVTVHTRALAGHASDLYKIDEVDGSSAFASFLGSVDTSLPVAVDYTFSADAGTHWYKLNSTSTSYVIGLDGVTVTPIETYRRAIIASKSGQSHAWPIEWAHLKLDLSSGGTMYVYSSESRPIHDANDEPVAGDPPTMESALHPIRFEGGRDYLDDCTLVDSVSFEDGDGAYAAFLAVTEDPPASTYYVVSIETFEPPSKPYPVVGWRDNKPWISGPAPGGDGLVFLDTGRHSHHGA